MNVLEVKRKLFHLLSGLITIFLFAFDFIGWRVILALLISLAVASYISRHERIPFFENFLSHMDRPHDRKRIPAWGALTYLFGIFLSILLFEKDIALAAISILVVGDSIAPLVGIHFGRRKHPLNEKKEIEGGIAGFVSSFLLALFFVVWYEAFFGAFFGMIVEALELKVKGRDLFN